MRPFSSTYPRSAMPRACCVFCSTSKVVVPWCRNVLMTVRTSLITRGGFTYAAQVAVLAQSYSIHRLRMRAPTIQKLYDREKVRIRETLKMAEGVGFEPTGRVNAQRFSRPPLSAAQPSLRMITTNPNIEILNPKQSPNSNVQQGPAGHTPRLRNSMFTIV